MSDSEPRDRDHGRWLHAALWASGWLLLGILFAGHNLLQAVAARKRPDLRTAVGIPVLEMLLWALLTPAVIWLTRRVPLARGHILRSLVVHVAAGLVLSVIQSLVNGPIFIAMGIFERWSWSHRELIAGMVLGKLVMNFITYGAIVAVAHASDLWARARDREIEASRLEAHLAEARLDVLRMQLHPHFLFNTLNAVSSLMNRDVAAADRVLTRLSDLLRMAMEEQDARDVPLRREIEFLRGYLDIQKIRFGDRFDFRLDVAPQALDWRIPPLLLQPIVENAIRHGLRNRATGGCVEIEAKVDGATLILEIRDNGVGLEAAGQRPLSPFDPGSNGDRPGGRGLANTRARLAYFYGAEHRFHLGPRPGGGTVARIEAPAPPAAAGAPRR